MPAPPEDLTAASGAFVMDGGTSRRALTTAMLDLASRGLIAFREETRPLGLSPRSASRRSPPHGDAVEEAQRTRNSRRPTGPAEAVRPATLRGLDGTASDYIKPDDLPKFGAAVADFDRALEGHVVAKGWLVEKPSKVRRRWVGRGVLAIVAGVVAVVRRAQRPDLRARPGRRRGDRRRDRRLGVRPGHAGGDDARRDDPGDARRLSADAPEDDGAGALDAAGRRRGRARLARDAGSGRRVGHGAWPPGRDRGGARARLEDVKRGPAPAASTYFPAWYHGLRAASRSRERPRPGSGGWLFSDSGDPGPRRDDVRARDDRELPVIVGQQRGWRVQRRLVRRRRRRRGRRVLARRGPRGVRPSVDAAPRSLRVRGRPRIWAEHAGNEGRAGDAALCLTAVSSTPLVRSKQA